MPIKSLALCCVFAVLTLLPASGATQSAKTKVYVVQGGRDSVGRTVAYLLREQVSRSNRYTLAASETEAEFEIDLASVDVDEARSLRNQGSGEWSAISVIFGTKTPSCSSWVYIAHGIHISGKSVANRTAQDLLAQFDEMVTARR